MALLVEEPSGDALARAIVASWHALHGPALLGAIVGGLQLAWGAQQATLLVHGCEGQRVVVAASSPAIADLERGAAPSPAARALALAERTRIGDVAGGAGDDPWCPAASRAGIGTALGMPLLAAPPDGPTGTVGALGIYYVRVGQHAPSASMDALLAGASRAVVSELLTGGWHRALDLDALPPFRAGGFGAAAVRQAAEGLTFLRRLADEQGLAWVKQASAQRERPDT